MCGGSWSFRVLRRPASRCRCLATAGLSTLLGTQLHGTPARRGIPRRPSNQTFVAVPKLKKKHISSTTVSTTNISMNDFHNRLFSLHKSHLVQTPILQKCRTLFQCEVSCIRDGMTLVQVILSHVFVVYNDELLRHCFTLRVHNGLPRSIKRFFLFQRNVLGLLMKETWLKLMCLSPRGYNGLPLSIIHRLISFPLLRRPTLSSSHLE